MAIKIDKSIYTPEELATYEALIAKATVDPEAGGEDMDDDVPADPPKKTKKAEVDNMDDTKKSAPTESPVIKAALEEMRAMKKSFEMKEMAEIAKKYAPLGKKESELAQTLYDMKKSNEANYNAYISILDESLSIVEKSGLFAEIGKSAGGAGTAGSAVEKAEAKAQAIMKADPSISYVDAKAQAWEDPDIMAEYDSEYYGRK